MAKIEVWNNAAAFEVARWAMDLRDNVKWWTNYGGPRAPERIKANKAEARRYEAAIRRYADRIIAENCERIMDSIPGASPDKGY
jgi:hypothetical protein